MKQAALAAYEQACTTADAARQSVDHLVNCVANGMTILRHWRQAEVTTADGACCMQCPGHSQVLDARTWPSAGQLAAAVTTYQQALRTLEAAWAQLSPAEQAIVDAPSALDAASLVG